MQTKQLKTFIYNDKSYIYYSIRHSLQCWAHLVLSFPKFSSNSFPCFYDLWRQFCRWALLQRPQGNYYDITIKMFKQMFPSLKLSVIRFIIIPPEPKLICGFSSILFWACFICKQITSFTCKKWLIVSVSEVTLLRKVLHIHKPRIVFCCIS